MPIHSKLWYLQQFKLIDTLSESHRRLLEQTMRLQEVKRGQKVYEPGDASEHIFLIGAGVIKISTVGPDNREVLLAFRHPGDLFGGGALFDDRPRDHLAKAHEDSLVCALNRDVMLRLARESPDLGFWILNMFSRRMKQFRTRIEQLSYKSASARVARTLIDLAKENGVKDDRGTVIAFRLSQSDLASLVGLTRETVNAVFHDLQQRGLVEADHRTIRVLDLQKLRAVH